MNKEQHLVTREIGIDAGHRVTHHGSKCRNLHGHRYTIQATCKGPLFKEGEQEGMVVDFSFLKEIMLMEIDDYCDHAMVLWCKDPFVQVLLPDVTKDEIEDCIDTGYRSLVVTSCPNNLTGKYYLVPFVPTAENLARHWFERMAGKIALRSMNKAELVNVKVWETPNCSAEYPGTRF